MEKVRSFFVSYFSAALSMFIIFLATMLVHYNMKIDFSYLGYATSHMAWLAIPSGLLGALIYKKHLVLKGLAGIILGLLTAALFVWVKTNNID